MLTDRHFPYSSMQEINLDWILTKVKNILRFVPDDGAVGQILRRTAHGAEWSNEQGGGGAVTSVNGQTGDVILSIPTDTSDLNNDSGFVDAAGAAAAAPVQSVNSQTGAVVLTKSDVGLGSVDNVQQYSASNPPPYPVTSVNTQTGDVILSIPTDTSDLNNDSGFVDAAGAAAAAPVQSVNGQTGTVVISTGTPLDAYPVGSIYMSVNSTSPANLFGGTWEQLKDRFLLGAGDTYTAGDVGGEATHILTTSEMPQHNHLTNAIGIKSGYWGTSTSEFAALRSIDLSDQYASGDTYRKTGTTGSGQAHNNMPPYLVVYMWKRTA